MPMYIVESAAKKKDVPDGKYGPMQVITLLLAAENATPLDSPTTVEWFTKATTPLPQPGSKIEGDITPGQYGPTFKRAAPAGGFGGGAQRVEDPKKSAAIQRMASVKAAHQSFELAYTLGIEQKPESPKAMLDALRKYADFWDADVAKIKGAA